MLIFDLFSVAAIKLTQLVIIDQIQGVKNLKFAKYFICVDNIAPHFVERGFVHVNEKINCMLSKGTHTPEITTLFCR
jgi:hypothetical protein